MEKNRETQLETLIRTIMEAGNAAGMAAAAVNKNGEVLWQKCCGMRDQEHHLPVNEDTIFGLASVTKSFTALSLLQLQEQGRLSVEDSAADYLPEFKGLVRGQPVKLRHLLSHSGGWYPTYRLCIPEVAEELGLNLADEDAGDCLRLAEEGCRRVASGLDHQRTHSLPGEQLSYCNDGYGLISEIIRRYGDCGSYAEYVKKHICEPLGMTRSGADFLRPAQDENSAVLYSVEDDGTERADRDYTNRAFVLGGGGAMKSTLRDMEKYLTMLLQNGTEVRRMTVPQVEYSPVSSYGFGLIGKKLGGVEVWEHSGSLPGVSSCICFSKDLGIASVVLCNTEDVSAGTAAEGVLLAAMGYDPAPTHRDFPPCPWTAEQSAAAAGNYDKDEGGDFTLSVGENGQPVLTADGQVKDTRPISPTQLQIRGRFGDLYLTLIKDTDGNIIAARYGSRIHEKRS